MYACALGRKDVVQLFLDHSDRIELNARDSFGRTAFMFACSRGRKDVVKLLLDCSEVVDIKIQGSYFQPSEEIKTLLNMHSKTVQNVQK